MADLVVRRSHGFQLDHVGLGVPDTEQGVDWVRSQTGADILLHAAEPDQWYWSGSLPIGKESFLEVIGTKTSRTRVQPIAVAFLVLASCGCGLL